jgi:hypothetical protein
MKIETTSFDTNYHAAVKHSSSNVQDYVRHEIDVYNQIIINDSIKLDAVYQTAQSYLHNDCRTPSANLELSEDSGTSKLLVLVNRLYESDFEDAANINESLAEAKALCSEVNTVEKLRQLYDTLNNNLPSLAAYLPDDASDDLDDYEDDEDGSGYLVKKNEAE